MDFSDALEFLNSLTNYEKGFEKYQSSNYQPDKVSRLLEAGEIDPSAAKIIHIAGTKGKGSTAFYTAKLIEISSNVKVGLYISPHLFRINERIQINSREIPDSDFSSIVERYSKILKDQAATYFEALTFIAMAYFIREGCQYIVLEVGLGGRLDSTNFCTPVVSVITPIAFDHTALLGNTLREIAAEKAGIIKPGVPVISGIQKEESLQSIAEIADRNISPLFRLTDLTRCIIKKRGESGSISDVKIMTDEDQLDMKDLGVRQLGDAAVWNLLLACVSVWFAGIGLSESVIRKAAMSQIPWRMQYTGRLLLDVSHNDSSLELLFQTLRDYLDKDNLHLFIGILSDKEIGRIADVIRNSKDVFLKITVFDFATSRKSGGCELYRYLKDIPSVDYLEDISRIHFDDNEFSVVTGSFYLAEKVREQFSEYF